MDVVVEEEEVELHVMQEQVGRLNRVNTSFLPSLLQRDDSCNSFNKKESYYITDKFKRRECNKFVPESAAFIDRCKCGNDSKDHSRDCFTDGHNYNAPWDADKDTITAETNAYGEINFMAAENDILPLYLRCAIETEVSDIADLFLNKWNMPLPLLLISVFGGHSKFDAAVIGDSLSDIKNGLVNAAKSTKAWLFTSGVNHGVSNLVGDAVAMKRSFIDSIPIIGVNSWGAVSDNQELIHPNGLFPAHYHTRSLAELSRDHTTGKPTTMALEHEHTHFILLDKGTRYNFHENEVRNYRIRLQRELVKQTQAQLVSVLVEGGVGSLNEARMRVHSGLPLIVLGDSGRIADVLCLAHDIAIKIDHEDGEGTKMVREFGSDEDRREVREKLRKALPHKDEAEYNDLMTTVEDVIRHDELITIWRAGRAEELDKTILRGLIKSLTVKVSHPHVSDTDEHSIKPSATLVRRVEQQQEEGKELLKRQLELAIQWNRLDIANEYIFTNMSLQESELNDLLGLAIQHKQKSFIDNIIERGAKIKSYMTEKRFEDLLNSTPPNIYLHKLLVKQCKNKARPYFLYEHFAQVVHYISDGVYRAPGKRVPSSSLHECSGDPSRTEILLDSIKICGPGTRNGNGNTYKYIERDTLGEDDNEKPTSGYNKYDFEDPEHLLVVYFSLIHEQEMAIHFWKYSRTPLFLALVCFHVHTWMKNKEKVSAEITDALALKLQRYGEEFEHRALQILEEANAYPPNFVIDLITYEFTKWGKLSALELADYTNAVDLIAHTSVQDYIDMKWNGWLDADITSFRILISLFLPFLASFRSIQQGDHKKSILKSPRTKDPAKEGAMKLSRRQSFVSRTTPAEISQNKSQTLPFLTKCKYFYKAPVTKFYIYMIIYVAFLFGYVVALLVKNRVDNASCWESGPISIRKIFNCKLTLSESFVYLWVFALIPLEVRQIYFSYPTTLKGKIRGYLSNIYNKNDLVCFTLVLTALGFRFLAGGPPVDDPDTHTNWYENMFKLCFSTAFIFYCLRVCQALQIDSQLGPKVMMMHKMLLDLMFFINLVAIFLIAYGVSTAAIINPNKYEKISFDLIFSTFWRPYVNLFGEFGNDDLMKEMGLNYCLYKQGNHSGVFLRDALGRLSRRRQECTEDYDCQDEEDNICVTNQYVVRILLAVYMMLAAVLMLNLLVAVFSSTYSNIEEKSATLWKRQKYDLMNEFQDRSILPVPLSTILHLFRFVKWLFYKTLGRLCCKKKEEAEPEVDEHDRVKIALLESECRRKFLEKQEVEEADTVIQFEMIKTIIDDIEKIDTKLKNFENSIQNVLDSNVTDTRQSPHSRASIGSSNRSSFGIDEVENDGLMLEETDLAGDDNLTVQFEENMPVDMAVLEPDENMIENVAKWSPARTPTESSTSRKSSVGSMKPADLDVLLKLGKRSRKADYPGCKMPRAAVKKDHWDWRHPLLKYKPVIYTDGSIEPDMKPADVIWNDNANGDERRSYEGKYRVVNNLPQSLCGRTGLSGRGKLARWGPNHSALPIITRYARDEKGGIATLGGKHVLEVMVECRDNDILALPEIKGKRDDPLPNKIRYYFSAQNLSCDAEKTVKILKRIDKIFKAGVLIYRGFLDSEYNTDNAWLESIIVSYHDSNDNAFCDVEFPENSPYRWSKIKNSTVINNAYREFLQKAFYARNGYDYIIFPQDSPLTQMYG